MRKRGRPRSVIVQPSDEAETKLDRQRLGLTFLVSDSTGSPPPIETLLAMSSDDLDREIQRVAATRKMRPFEVAWSAACAINTLEHGTQDQATLAKVIRRLRSIQPSRERSDAKFLASLIKHYAPGWQWRDQIDAESLDRFIVRSANTSQGRRLIAGMSKKDKAKLDRDPKSLDLADRWQLHHRTKRKSKENPDLEVDETQRRNTAIAEETARIARREAAMTNQFITPDEPDLSYLSHLRGIAVNDSTTWPTVRDLKMVTAMSERTIKEIIAGLRPKRSEICMPPLRHRGKGRGAFPKRYGPRLVVGVLQQFMRRLTESVIRDADAEILHKTALSVVRSLGQRLSSWD